MMLLMLTITLGAYFCGSVPFGKIIAYSYGIDIQKRGSGNIGFANVLRVIGWKAAIPVLLLDVTKGFLPTILAHQLFGVTLAFGVGVCAILGHLFPIWLRFRGGKGIATGLGVLLATTPLVGCSAFVVYIGSSLVLRNSARASIIAGLTVFITGAILYPEYLWAYSMLLLIALWTLRKNLFGKATNLDIRSSH